MLTFSDFSEFVQILHQHIPRVGHVPHEKVGRVHELRVVELGDERGSLDAYKKFSKVSALVYLLYKLTPRVLLKSCAGQRLVRSGKDPKQPLPDLVVGLGFRLQALGLRV